MADDMYGGELPEDGLNEVLDAPASLQNEIASLKKRLAEAQAEAQRLHAQQNVAKEKATKEDAAGVGHDDGKDKVEDKDIAAGEEVMTEDAKNEAETQKQREEIDARSVYVGNVDYATTPEELHAVFQSCGTINRVTVQTDRSGAPKGYAYVEFLEPDAMEAAIALTDTEIHNRPIKVTPKRTNNPGMRRGRGRGRGRGYYDYYGWYGYPPPMPYFPGPVRGRGRRGRWFAPY